MLHVVCCMVCCMLHAALRWIAVIAGRKRARACIVRSLRTAWIRIALRATKATPLHSVRHGAAQDGCGSSTCSSFSSPPPHSLGEIRSATDTDDNHRTTADIHAHPRAHINRACKRTHTVATHAHKIYARVHARSLRWPQISCEPLPLRPMRSAVSQTRARLHVPHDARCAHAWFDCRQCTRATGPPHLRCCSLWRCAMYLV
jgi:hypothetical protein